MKPRILSYDVCEKEIWDAFVFRETAGYVYYLYDMIAIDRWQNDKNHSFAIWDDDKNEIVMICMLHLEKREIYDDIFYRLHSRWGFCVKHGIVGKEFNKLSLAYKQHIDGYYKKYDIRSFEIAFPPLAECRQPEAGLTVNPGIFFGFKPGIRYTYVVNLKKSDKDILMGLESTTRHDIKKIMEKDRYKIRVAQNNVDDYDTYIKLHKETFTRTGNPEAIIHDDYHKNMFFNLIPQKICRVYFLDDEINKNVVATIAILFYKNTAYYWWGASSNQRETGVNKYLLYSAIMDFKHENDEKYDTLYFETGGAYPYLEGGIEKGWNDFKKCFGTFLHPIYTGIYT